MSVATPKSYASLSYTSKGIVVTIDVSTLSGYYLGVNYVIPNHSLFFDIWLVKCVGIRRLDALRTDNAPTGTAGHGVIRPKGAALSQRCT